MLRRSGDTCREDRLEHDDCAVAEAASLHRLLRFGGLLGRVAGCGPKREPALDGKRAYLVEPIGSLEDAGHQDRSDPDAAFGLALVPTADGDEDASVSDRGE